MDNVYEFVELMPKRLKSIFNSLDKEILCSISEIRIRRRKPLIIYIQNDIYFISSITNYLVNKYTNSCVIVDDESFNIIIDRICNNSYHTKMNTMIKGYITTSKGSRVGIASSAVYRDKDISIINDISSLNIRISHSFDGISKEILDLVTKEKLTSFIVAGKPSGGKTTLLRDIAKLISSTYKNYYLKTAVIDERGELSSGFNLGINTDVLKYFDKPKGIEIATRTLSPDVIICDEIGNISEAQSVVDGFYTGVKFIVSVHMEDVNEIYLNPVVKTLINSRQFDYIVLLKNYTQEYEIINLRMKSNENHGCNIDSMLNNSFFIDNIEL